MQSPDPLLFCPTCSKGPLESWKGWPGKDPIPMLKSLEESLCKACDSSWDRPIKSTNIRWINIHARGSTGLPSYWKIAVVSDDSYAQFGLPYYGTEACPRCDCSSILSLVNYPSGQEFFSNCPKCGLQRTRDTLAL